eukprot:TRINITY_DN4585_c0_g1_i3.p1 TRINITY_DN4585_c0_g1~~TRINITY_DN4585_c0_g1_i3.p1  ORF type:complete len:180 (-),score=33.29 TRINITY_DN4585_c0_g1_i3:554-1093(-)
MILLFFFFQAEDGIRDLVRSRGLGDVYKRQINAEYGGFGSIALLADMGCGGSKEQSNAHIKVKKEHSIEAADAPAARSKPVGDNAHVKIVLVGNTGVGKTCLLDTLLGHKQISEWGESSYVPTAAANHSMEIEVEGTNYDVWPALRTFECAHSWRFGTRLVRKPSRPSAAAATTKLTCF